MEFTENEIVISKDKSLLSIEKVCDLLSKSYWANTRTRERIEHSINNSICYGVYHKNEQIGFARVITDYATMYWLCDVLIDEDYRGKGLGKKLVDSIINSEELKDLRGVLGTKDAHSLYEQSGFIKDSRRFMFRQPEVMGG